MKVSKTYLRGIVIRVMRSGPVRKLLGCQQESQTTTTLARATSGPSAERSEGTPAGWPVYGICMISYTWTYQRARMVCKQLLCQRPPCPH